MTPKWLILTIIAGLTVMAGATAVFLSIKNIPLWTKTAENTNSQNWTPFKVIVLRDNVYLKSKNSTEKLKIENSVEATPITNLSTSNSGRAVMESPNGSKTLLNSDSEIEVSAHEENGNKTAINLFFGSTWSRIEKIFEKGEFYELKTRNAAAVVRGTSFGTNFLDNTTIILVTKGLVFIYEVDDSGNVLERTETPVNAGEKAIRRGKEKIIISALTAKDKESEWYKLNNPAPASFVSPLQSETDPAPASNPKPDIPASTPIQINPSPAEKPKPIFDLVEVRPQTAIAGKDLVTLKGSGFLKTNALLLGLSSISSYRIVDNSTLEFIVPISIEPRTYDVSIINIDGQTDVLKDALTVQSPPQPEPKPSPQSPPPTEEQPPQNFLLYNGQDQPPPQ